MQHRRSWLLQLLLKQLGRACVAQVLAQPLQLRLNFLIAGVQRQCKLSVGDRFGKLPHALRMT
jgi:hypothetical protein